MNKKDMSEEMKAFRARNKLTQVEAAAILGITDRMVRYIETGRLVNPVFFKGAISYVEREMKK